MFCERCKKTEATIHLSEVIKDMKSEVHLCEMCARDVGLNTKISNFSLSLPEMLTFLNVDELTDYSDGKHCQVCGSGFMEYKKEGKLSCPECYNNLSEFLAPVLAGFHGEKLHIGKSPVYSEDNGLAEKTYKKEKSGFDNRADLQSQLESAVIEERYEDAAVLRDKIKEINFSLKNSG